MDGLQFLKLTHIIIGLNFTSILHGRYNALQVHRPQSLILDTTDCATQPLTTLITSLDLITTFLM